MFSSLKSGDRSLRKESGALLKIGLPVIIAQLLQTSMNFVDTIMVGNFSAHALASVAVGGAIFMPVLMLAAGTLMAVNPIVAQLLGARDFRHIGVHARQSLWLSQLLAFVLFFVMRNTGFVMVWMDVEPSIIPTAVAYLSALSWGIFPVTAYMALRYFNEGISVTRPGMYMALAGLITNLIGNYILIYGKLGFPQMGAKGSGYASAISMGVMFVGMLVFTVRHKPYKRFAIFSKFKWPEKLYFKEQLSVGIPIGVSSTMEVTMFAAVSLLMGSLGTVIVAGHQIAINFAAMTFMVPFGLSTAITVRVGNAAGRQNMAEARFRGFTGVALSVAFMTFTALVMVTIPNLITGMYTDNLAVKEVAVSLLYMAAIFQISDGLQVSSYGALRGLKDTKIPMIVNLIAYWLVGLPLAYYLGITKEAGPQGLWIGLIAGLTVAAILHNVRFWRETRPNNFET